MAAELLESRRLAPRPVRSHSLLAGSFVAFQSRRGLLTVDSTLSLYTYDW